MNAPFNTEQIRIGDQPIVKDHMKSYDAYLEKIKSTETRSINRALGTNRLSGFDCTSYRGFYSRSDFFNSGGRNIPVVFEIPEHGFVPLEALHVPPNNTYAHSDLNNLHENVLFNSLKSVGIEDDFTSSPKHRAPDRELFLDVTTYEAVAFYEKYYAFILRYSGNYIVSENMRTLKEMDPAAISDCISIYDGRSNQYLIQKNLTIRDGSGFMVGGLFIPKNVYHYYLNYASFLPRSHYARYSCNEDMVYRDKAVYLLSSDREYSSNFMNSFTNIVQEMTACDVQLVDNFYELFNPNFKIKILQ